MKQKSYQFVKFKPPPPPAPHAHLAWDVLDASVGFSASRVPCILLWTVGGIIVYMGKPGGADMCILSWKYAVDMEVEDGEIE